MPIEATTITPPPETSELLQSLADFRAALPTTNAIKQDVLRSLHHPNTSAVRVARAIAQDPALSLQVILSANQLLARQGLEAKYLSHSISLMGLPQLEQIVRATPEYGDNKGYEEQLNQCWIAADLTQQLKLTAVDEDQEQLFFSSLAMRFHELALWSVYPQRMQQVERLKANPIYDHEHVERRVLGLTINDIGKQLAAHWPLPKVTQQCWRDGFQLSDSGNNSAINQANCIKLCQVVSSLGSRNWYHPETLAAQQLLAKEARADDIQVINQSRQSCIRAPYNGWGPHPAARLLMHWEHQKNLIPLFWETAKPETAAPQVQHETQPETKQPAPTSPETGELDSRLKRLQQRGSSFADLNELLLFTLETQYQTLQTEQSMILVLNRERTHLRFQYCRGVKALKGQTIELNPQHTALFQKLLAQPSSLRVDGDNLHQCVTQLSPRLAAVFATKHSAMTSLFHNRQPLGIMFIKKSKLSSADFADFKKLASATNSGIAELARIRHRRAL